VSVSPTPLTLDVAGQAGVPADARAVVLSVRRGGASPVEAVWAWPSGSDRPVAPSWRRASGSGSVAQVVVPLGADGRMRVAADSAGAVSLDVAGYVAAGDDRAFHPLVPQRLTKDGLRLDRRGATTVSVAGRAGVPRSATSVVVALSGSRSTGPARVQLWPRGATAPSTPDLVVPRKDSRETVSVVRLGRGGDLLLKARDARVRAELQVLGWIG
jgi:hypothetical protein